MKHSVSLVRKCCVWIVLKSTKNMATANNMAIAVLQIANKDIKKIEMKPGVVWERIAAIDKAINGSFY